MERVEKVNPRLSHIPKEDLNNLNLEDFTLVLVNSEEEKFRIDLMGILSKIIENKKTTDNLNQHLKKLESKIKHLETALENKEKENVIKFTKYKFNNILAAANLTTGELAFIEGEAYLSINKTLKRITNVEK